MDPRPRTHTRRAFLNLASVATLATALSACGAPATRGGSVENYPAEAIEILVPAAPGGGWDQTARALQGVIKQAGLSDKSVEVVNRGGGGGATGLAEFTSSSAGDPYKLMMGGLVMVGALQLAKSPVKITDATVVATLTSEAVVIVVPADSPFQSIQQVIDAYAQDPASVAFGGGSKGGSDHMALGLLLAAAGKDPAAMKFISYDGGAEATTGILSGDVEVGLSGISEFAGQIESGAMRVLAISADERIEIAGKTAPTLVEAGYDVDFVNWRAIFAPPGLTDEQLTAVRDFIAKVHATPEWQDVLKKNGWTDDYHSGAEAEQFITDQQKQTATILQELGL